MASTLKGESTDHKKITHWTKQPMERHLGKSIGEDCIALTGWISDLVYLYTQYHDALLLKLAIGVIFETFESLFTGEYSK